MKLKKFTARTTLSDGRVYPIYTEVPDQETANQIMESVKSGLSEPEEIVHEEYFDGGWYQTSITVMHISLVLLVLFIFIKAGA